MQWCEVGLNGDKVKNNGALHLFGGAEQGRECCRMEF